MSNALRVVLLLLAIGFVVLPKLELPWSPGLGDGPNNGPNDGLCDLAPDVFEEPSEGPALRGLDAPQPALAGTSKPDTELARALRSVDEDAGGDVSTRLEEVGLNALADARVRLRALRRLVQLSPVHAQRVLAEIVEDAKASHKMRRAAAKLLGRTRPDPLPLLARYAFDPALPASIRAHAVAGVAAVGTEAAVAFVGQLATDEPRSTTSLAALESLGQFRAEAATDALATRIGTLDGHPEAMALAVASIGRRPTARGIDALRTLASDATLDRTVRYAVLDALGACRGNVVREVLTEMLHDADPEIRRAARIAYVRAVGRTPPEPSR